MVSYGSLRKAMLAKGLSDAGFVVASEYLVRDMGECVGGIGFQKSKYDADQFFVEAGVFSKRRDRFMRRFTTRDCRLPYAVDRAQVSTRLESEAADRHRDSWTLNKTKPINELVDRLNTMILHDGIAFFESWATDEKLRDELIAYANANTGTYWRKILWPFRHIALLDAAIVTKDIGPAGRFEKVAEMARTAANTPMEREYVDKILSELNETALNPEDLLPQEALERLKELTGEDFGNDYAAWQAYLKSTQKPFQL